MTQYAIYCTPAQTRKALELGAPIKYKTKNVLHTDGAIYPEIEEDSFGNPKYIIPTAEQMIGWLEEQEEISDLHIFKPAIHWTFELYASNGDGKNNQPLFNSRKEATIAAIDAALEYLSNNMNNHGNS